MSLFGDRLTAAVSARGSQLVLGLDPPAMPGREIARWCERLIGSAGDECVAVKLQLACFERAGAAGWRALEDVGRRAGSEGLLVIADGKRGDVATSATAYGEAILREPFDALTVNPVLGEDALAPMLDAAASDGRGLFAVVRTSNPGAGEIQDLELADGRPWHLALADRVSLWGSTLVGSSGLSALGAVVGATAPDRARAIRQVMPDQPLLMPGIGAQGATPDDLVGAFGERPAGVLVPVSRGIAESDDPRAAAWHLRESIWRAYERERAGEAG